MADRTQLKTTEDVIARNIRLTFRFMRYLMSRPGIVKSLPDNFELVLLPVDDPELRAHSFALLDHPPLENKPLVIVRMSAAGDGEVRADPADIYVPLALAT